jgi:ribosomal protein S18 acetylase RimI-like enzyme
VKEIIIRAATLDDLPVLLAFEQLIIEAERPYGDTIKIENASYYDLKEYIMSDKVSVCVAVINDEIIGSGYAKIVPSKPYHTHEQYSYCGFMYVKPKFRGQGINQLVIDYLKNWSLEQGLTEMRLNVYLDNLPAIHAYRKAGFTHNILEMRMPI